MSYAAEALQDLHDAADSDVEHDDASSVSGSVNEEIKQILRERPPFASNVRGRQIRHARTGAYYAEKVGSWQQNYYFKVCDASGLRRNLGKSESDFYFFDSPSDYRKYGGTVHPDVEEAWHTRLAKLPVRS